MTQGPIVDRSLWHRAGASASGLGAAALLALAGTGALPAKAPASRAAGAGGTVGTVASVDAKARTFVVRTQTGSKVTVKVTSATAFRDSLVHVPRFADVKVGDSVAVIGTTAHDVETASLVILGGSGSTSGGGSSPGGGAFAGGFGRGTFGKVTAVDAKAHTFTLRTTNGSSLKVKVTSSTTYRDRASTKAGFADVKVGSEVAVIGTTTKGVDEARSVLIGLGAFGPASSAGGAA